MKLEAFNLIRGLVMEADSVYGKAAWVVAEVNRDADNEWVEVEFILHSDQAVESVFTSRTYDYCEIVEVIGVCIAAEEINDTNFGTEVN